MGLFLCIFLGNYLIVSLYMFNLKQNNMTYKEQVQQWLDTPSEERNLEVGAKLMIQGNRNRILYDHVIRKSNFDKVEYELTKIMGDDLRNNDEAIELKLVVQVNQNETTQPKEEDKGKRVDHDTLPETVKSAFEKNLSIYPEMRSLHERLKVLSETGTAADRLPFLEKLLALDKELRENWNVYDNFDASAVEPQCIAAVPSPIDAKRISANRKYLSSNKSKLEKLLTEEPSEKSTNLFNEMQIRITEILSVGETFSADQLAEFKQMGLNG